MYILMQGNNPLAAHTDIELIKDYASFLAQGFIEWDEKELHARTTFSKHIKHHINPSDEWEYHIVEVPNIDR